MQPRPLSGLPAIEEGKDKFAPDRQVVTGFSTEMKKGREGRRPERRRSSGISARRFDMKQMGPEKMDFEPSALGTSESEIGLNEGSASMGERETSSPNAIP